jgi:predicted HAD superfamily Cof-like phosphohydrolase
MAKSYFEDVKGFHKATDSYIAESPEVVPEQIKDLRIRLIKEEYSEFMEELESDNIPKIAKECADLVYVLMGTMASYGIPFDTVWELVQENNMKKVGLPKNEFGKVIKPPDWKNADEDVKKLIDGYK